jgi:hypothetical protein
MLCSILGPNKTGSERDLVIDRAIRIISDRIKDAGDPAYYAYFRDTRQAEMLRDTALQGDLFIPDPS